MVSFHQDSQRLAVGTSENVIIIYDLKTATRWHVLEGHKNAVSAVAFNENGKALASYSILETTVRIWHTGTSFFGILGSQPQCVKTFTVSKPNSMLNSFASLWCIYILTLNIRNNFSASPIRNSAFTVGVSIHFNIVPWLGTGYNFYC